MRTGVDTRLLMRLAAASIVLGVLVGSSSAKSRGNEEPSWVREVASRAVPSLPGKVPAFVLLNSQEVTVDSSGLMTTQTRYAVKILTHDGKDEAEVLEFYERGGRQVLDLRAWLVEPDGKIRTYEKGSVEDLGAFNGDLYNDIRLRRIRLSNPELNSVFVYESRVQDKANEGQDRFVFGNRLPVFEARYSLTLPTGWNCSGKMMNAAPLQSSSEGNTSRWILKNLPYRESEPFAPQLAGSAPTLAVDFGPPSGTAGPAVFHSWSDVADWHARIADGQTDSSPSMQAKVRELTASASDTLAKIRTIGHFVQSFRYIEIATDLGNQGGFRPHLASQVFDRQYGDCKDKVNLMRAMLKTAGLASFPVAIYSGDRTHVKEEWPSPSQFNHAILAIPVDSLNLGNAVVDTPVGRALLFDPTDEKTPMGDLPIYEQGSLALLCASGRGSLLRVPVFPPETNRMTETVRATLASDGHLDAAFSRESTGQSARGERALSASAEESKTAFERTLGAYIPALSVSDWQTRDVYLENCFTTKAHLTSLQYAKVIGTGTLMINPAVLPTPALRLPSTDGRSAPIIVNGRLYRKQVELELPPGYSIEEMPAPFSADASFAHFSVSYREAAGKLLVEEELRTETAAISPARYREVKKFFDNVAGADRQSLILVKR